MWFGPDIVNEETTKLVTHVYPTFGRDHDTTGEAMCWCAPVIEEYRHGVVVIHSAEH
jgi:hypothetical protein